MGAHDKVGDCDFISSNELLAVVSELLLHLGVELFSESNTCGHSCGLFGFRSIGQDTKVVHHVTPHVDDWVAVHASLPVLCVVVAEADAKCAHNGAKLSDVHRLAVLLIVNLRQATSKLTHVTSFFSNAPGLGINRLLSAWLLSVTHHLGDRVGSAHAVKVLEVQIGTFNHSRIRSWLSNGFYGCSCGDTSGTRVAWCLFHANLGLSGLHLVNSRSVISCGTSSSHFDMVLFLFGLL